MSLSASPSKRFFLALSGIVLVLGLAGAGSHLWASHHLHEAERLVTRQEFAEAYPHIVDALKVWRRSADTELLAGRIARRAMMYTEAESHFKRCHDLAGADKAMSAAVALERVLIQVQSGELRENDVMLMEKVKRNDPDSLLILEALARGYTRMLRYGPAMRCLRLILERDPDNVEALFNRGRLGEFTTGPVEALKDYRHALELRPDRDDVRLHLARVLLRDNPAEAVRHLEQLVERKPENLDMLLDLANAYTAASDADHARLVMDKILEIDPENSRALSEKGAFLVASQKVAEGEALLRRAIARDPFNIDAHYQLYLCLGGQQGREAERDAQGVVHERLKAENDRMNQILSVEMSKSPENPDLLYQLGMIYYRRGLTETALRWLNQALKFNPNHQPSQKALFDLYMKLGDKENAEQVGGGSNSKSKQ